MKKQLGKNNQINATYSDYYEFIGYLANHPKVVSIVWQNNQEQGAWAKEGRIQFRNDEYKYFQAKGFNFTAGRAGISARLNCNSFIEELNRLGFQQGAVQDLNAIRANIDPQYINDFNIGVNLP